MIYFFSHDASATWFGLGISAMVALMAVSLCVFYLDFSDIFYAETFCLVPLSLCLSVPWFAVVFCIVVGYKIAHGSFFAISKWNYMFHIYFWLNAAYFTVTVSLFYLYLLFAYRRSNYQQVPE